MKKPSTPCEARAIFNNRVTLRDGIQLAADVYLPPADGKAYPVILMFSPYDATSGRSPSGLAWAARGFAFVSADCRGRFKSGGLFHPWENLVEDAYDLLDWIARQPWCNGRIGMVGGSYVAVTQLAAAASGHPALKAAAPSAIQSDPYGIYYTGGAMVLAFMAGWHIGMTAPRGKAPATPPDWSLIMRRLPVSRLDAFAGIPSPTWRAVTAHPARDAFWESRATTRGLASCKASLFMQGGWFDPICPSILDDFNVFSGRHTCLRMGPWAHGVNMKEGELDYGPQALVTEEGEVDFLTSILACRRPATAGKPPLRLFILGANVWRDEHEWPLARTRWMTLYLGSGGKANTSAGDGMLAREPVPGGAGADTFTYDPENPVPTCGGRFVGCGGQRSQAEIEKRNDVLVYTLPPLKADLEVTGPVTVRLFVSSSAPATDFTVKLVDVFPDGRPFSVCDGIRRVRLGGGIRAIHEIEVGVDVTACLFRRGHRIRIEISSSNFPRFSRHPNTVGAVHLAAKTKPALQRVHHSDAHPSRIILPVIPAGPGPVSS